ncbi:TPA: hypothetical protein ACTZLV_002666 [Acinetobacter baumannii]|uniref:Uncharacterized protein n=1 Tax=Acinetobacter baumannii TaxID=470 RepID=A0A8B5UL33_ACIBA|nr:hypothetical protein [Acinetobacter baumannii]ARG33976.1 hypothetical protein B7L46_03130 [Acinetobacter baumannii]EME5682542.1 hypothetical protein [Acinetobacter baumannii]KAA8931491.1 hypothetical protein DLI67_17960 [Acinetobacter baumannii]KAA8938056.1 hypothetical protein DLI68_08265 [Acinetobacter baumannii]MBD0176387.1 hypothetical protein [Acinetobacter baumannii]
MNIEEIKDKLIEQKNNFLDEKYLDWYVETYIRNYPEFLEMDYQNAINLAQESFKDDSEWLNNFNVEMQKSYQKAKQYLELS